MCIYLKSGIAKQVRVSYSSKWAYWCLFEDYISSTGALEEFTWLMAWLIINCCEWLARNTNTRIGRCGTPKIKLVFFTAATTLNCSDSYPMWMGIAKNLFYRSHETLLELLNSCIITSEITELRSNSNFQHVSERHIWFWSRYCLIVKNLRSTVRGKNLSTHVHIYKYLARALIRKSRLTKIFF